MSFLKTLFWIVVAVTVALFCFNNWTIVAINLWNGMILETKLPLLLYQAVRYRLRRQTSMAPPAPVATAEPTIAPAGPYTTMPPGGA